MPLHFAAIANRYRPQYPSRTGRRCSRRATWSQRSATTRHAAAGIADGGFFQPSVDGLGPLDLSACALSVALLGFQKLELNGRLGRLGIHVGGLVKLDFLLQCLSLHVGKGGFVGRHRGQLIPVAGSLAGALGAGLFALPFFAP
jgi:hypothetical protein